MLYANSRRSSLLCVKFGSVALLAPVHHTACIKKAEREGLKLCVHWKACNDYAALPVQINIGALVSPLPEADPPSRAVDIT